MTFFNQNGLQMMEKKQLTIKNSNMNLMIPIKRKYKDLETIEDILKRVNYKEATHTNNNIYNQNNSLPKIKNKGSNGKIKVALH